jgi:PAS domain S-box-containing protein
MKLSLTQKGLILLSVPLLFQLIFVSVLIALRHQAEIDAQQAKHAQAVSETVNRLEGDIYDIVSNIEGNDPSQFGLDTSDYKRAVGNIVLRFETLRQLVKDNPGDLATVDQGYAYAKELVLILKRVEDVYANGSTVELMHAFSVLRPKFKLCIKHVVSRKLIDLSEAQRVLAANETSDLKFRNRLHQVMIIAIVLNIILTVALALVFTREITARIKVITTNSLRLANNQALLDAVSGGDEIAALDQVFHDMAKVLAENAIKERAILENAADVIFSINGKGTFSSLNPAVFKVFGYSPNELIGSKYMTLIPEENKEFTLATVTKMMEGGESRPFETRMKRKDGSVVDVSWAAQWSESQKSLFCVLHDVTARKAVDRLRQEVMQMVTHDLRTPLATIGNVLSILEDGRVGEVSDRAKEMVQLAQKNVSRMLELVNDLLEVEKMKAGMLKLDLDEVSLADIFEESLHAVSGWAQEQKVRIEYVPTTLKVFADEGRIVQVLNNLLGNAIKFSPAGKRVVLSAHEAYDYVEVRVKDEGRGIPENQRDVIFERFQQVHLSDAANRGGSGLGLAICKAILERHGGSIRVDSEEGFGSTFSFRLPKSREHVKLLQRQFAEV